jgi:hypothetical protein
MTRELDPDNAGAGITTLSGFPPLKFRAKNAKAAKEKHFLLCNLRSLRATQK